MRQLATIIIMAFCAIMAHPAHAEQTKEKKKGTITIGGEVYDSFTIGKIKAFITLMDTDSTVVDTMTCHAWERGTYSWYQFDVPREEKTYIVKAVADGYEDTYLNYELNELKRHRYKELPRMLMKKKQEDVYKDVMLDGVVVKGTRIQVAYKGDTIVYDASAFKLPEGSMLDGLIRQLPGAELKDNGDIYINGEKIDYLTLNGKDFFKNDNKVMLENLPYFTVKDLKVFHKDTKMSEMLGKQMEEKEFVMDVTLKREYSRGYIANAEVGAGTDDRYAAKLFGMFYNDHTRVSAYGNINNVNENRTPGSDGEWNPQKVQNGVLTTKQAGVNINTEDKNKRVTDNADIRLEWRDSDNESETFRETFSDNGSIFGNSWSKRRSKNFSFNVSNNIQVDKINLYIYNSLYHSNYKSKNESGDSTYTTTLTNRGNDISNNKNKYITLYQYVSWSKPLNSGDYLNISVNANYNNTKPSDSFYKNRTYYAGTGATDVRNRYTDNHNSNYYYAPRMVYYLSLPNDFMLGTTYEYRKRYESKHNERMNLERLTESEEYDLGWLPSLREDIDKAFDRDNSYRYTSTTNSHTPAIYLQRYNKNSGFHLSLPLSFNTEKMNYHGNQLDTVARRSYVTFSPYITFRTRGKTQRPVLLEYRTRVTTPGFSTLMPLNDTSNPLSLYLNNPDIKSSMEHHLKTRFTFRNDSIGSNLYIGFETRLMTKEVGTRTTYNPNTGAYTRMNDNVDGNWTAFINSGWQRPLDANKRFRIDLYGKAEYVRSVDFATITTQPTTEGDNLLQESPLSKVDNVNLIARTKLTYKLGDFSAGVNAKITSRHTRGHLDIVRSIDANDFQYGMNATYTIPLVKLTITTDLTMFSRRGYESSVMNTDELIWNAQLSRTFCKGALTAKLLAYDLLQNLSSTRYSINAQGRTETWYNYIPRYVMCSLAYKFNRKPKK